MSGSFGGQVVLITGASSGIGAELARQLAACGAHLVLAARREERLRKLVSEIDGMGKRAIAVTCDVTRDGDCEHAVAEAIAEFGRLDVVIANAGFGVVGRVEHLSVDDYKRQYETNVFGVVRTLKAALPEVQKVKGRLVVMGSVAGWIALPESSAYGSSKFAVGAIAFSLRRELAYSGTSVTLISPGFVASEISQVDNTGVHHADAKEGRPSRMIMATDVACAQMIRAIRRRKAHAVITGHGKLGVFMTRHFPWLLDLALRFFPRTRHQPNHDAAPAPAPPAATA